MKCNIDVPELNENDYPLGVGENRMAWIGWEWDFLEFNFYFELCKGLYIYKGKINFFKNEENKL